MLLACGSSDPTSNTSASVTAEAACEHEFRARFERCGSDDVAPATTASARTRYVESCVGALGLSGSTRTADEVDACAKAVEEEDCGELPKLLPACAPKAGTLPPGSACNVDAQCQGGHCDLLDAQAKGRGCGVCVEPIPEGGPCDPERPACELGTLCFSSEASPETVCRRARYVDENASCARLDTLCKRA